MAQKTEYSYTTLTEEDEAQVANIAKDTFTEFLNGDFWMWKYKANPDFDPSLVVVAKKDGEIVGCNHWLLRDLKISCSLILKAALGADIAVHPDHRGQGIGKTLLRFLRSPEVFRKRGVIISYMFARPELSKRLYSPAVGYVLAPNSTKTYTKKLKCNELKQRIQLINHVINSRRELHARIEKMNFNALFRLRGAPPFVIEMTSNGVNLREEELKETDMIVEGNFSLFVSALEGKRGIGSLIKAWLTGEIKVKKGMLKILKLFRVFKLMKLALKEK